MVDPVKYSFNQRIMVTQRTKLAFLNLFFSIFYLPQLCPPLTFAHLNKNLRNDTAMMSATPIRNAILTAIKKKSKKTPYHQSVILSMEAVRSLSLIYKLKNTNKTREKPIFFC